MNLFFNNKDVKQLTKYRNIFRIKKKHIRIKSVMREEPSKKLTNFNKSYRIKLNMDRNSKKIQIKSEHEKTNKLTLTYQIPKNNKSIINRPNVGDIYNKAKKIIRNNRNSIKPRTSIKNDIISHIEYINF